MRATRPQDFGYVIRTVRGQFVPQLEMARHLCVVRLLPNVEPKIFEEEADRIATELYDHRVRTSTSDDYDAADQIADHAFWEANEFYQAATEMRQGFVNLLFVYLYHLFEQQLAKLVRNEFDSTRFLELKNALAPLTRGKVAPRHFSPKDSRMLFQAIYEVFGFDITVLDTWDPINELRWIANVVKHPEAQDCEKLRNRRLGLFDPPGVEEIVKEFPDQAAVIRKFMAPSKTELALAGVDLWLKSEDLEAKAQAIGAFWEEFCQVLSGEKSPPTVRDRIYKGRESIKSIAEKCGATNVRIYGPAATGNVGPADDVNVLYVPSPAMLGLPEVGFQQDLSDFLDRPVRAAREASLKGNERERVLKEAVPI